MRGRRINMSIFVIDTDNLTLVHTDSECDPTSTQVTFSSAEEFATVAADWPLARLVAIWNRIPDLTPVNRFTDRQTAVRRIWDALQPATPIDAKANGCDQSQTSGAAACQRKSRRPTQPLARPASKKALVMEMLRQPKGATLKEIMHATGWQAHSVRGFISGSLVKRAELKVSSSRRSDGERVYRVSRG
jgi:hypothetical protein